MPRSFLSQDLQVASTPDTDYNDAVTSVHTEAGAETTPTSLLDDLNVLRSLMRDVVDPAGNWYDEPDMYVNEIANKYFITLLAPASFTAGTTITAAASTNAFDTAIKTITNHNNGAGSSTAEGVIVDATKAYRIEIREHATQNPIDDGNNNEVYGRLSWSGTEYIITWYSFVSGTETPYTFTTTPSIDIGYVSVSRPYSNLDWDIFLQNGWHDVTGPTGTVADDSVTVDGMDSFLNGLTTQAQVNERVDNLGESDVNGQGAHYIGIDDTATGSNSYFTGTDLMTALTELTTQLGGLTSGTYDFTSDIGPLADDDAVYAALNKLNNWWVDLGTADGTASQGANMVGVQDPDTVFTATTVEGVLKELYDSIQDVTGWEKALETTAGVISADTDYTIPVSYTVGAGANLDVYLDGQLLAEGSDYDYIEVGTAGTSSTTIQFKMTVPGGKNITYMVRQ